MTEENPKIDIKDYNLIKEKYSNLLNEEQKLTKELNEIYEEQNKLTNELAAIEAQTEQKIEDINLAKRIEGPINEEELQKKCSAAVEKFLKDINDENGFGTNLTIRIEYQNMKIFKTILNENLTFSKLKDETKLQFGKEADEFYFSDENGNIFLDELRVVPALFPLSEVKIKDYEPKIIVVDKITFKKRKDNEIDDLNYTQTKKIIRSKNPFENLLKFFNVKGIKFIIFSAIFIIFLILWIKSCLNFLRADSIRCFRESYKNFFYDYIKDKEPLEIVDETRYLFNLVDCNSPENEDDYCNSSDYKNNYFGKFNKIYGSVGFVLKKKKKNENCENNRLGFTPKICDDIFNEEIEKEFIGKFNNTTYSYPYRHFDSRYKLKTRVKKFDSNGYFLNLTKEELEDESYENHTDFFENNKTLLFKTIINAYNIHMNMMFIIVNDYVKIEQEKLHYYEIYGINMDKSIDVVTIFSIIFSLLLLGMLFFLLKKEEALKNILNKKQKKFRLPNFFEWLCLIDILFYYIILIIRSTFLGKLNDDNPNLDEFIDLFQIAYRNQIIHILESINILAFFGVLLYVLYYYVFEFQVISKSITNFMLELLPFTIGILFPFIMISMAIFYYLGGDFSLNIHNYMEFDFVKALQAFFRGSMENSDFNDYSNSILSNSYNNLIYTNSYFEIVHNVGKGGYIIFSVIFFLFSFIIIKGGIISYSYLVYRDKYLDNCKAIEREEKREKIEKIIQEREKEKKLKEEEERKQKEKLEINN